MKPGTTGSNVATAISKEMVQVNAVHVNVAQEYIMITEDKTYRCINDWKSRIESKNQWIAPVSLLSSLTLTFVTSTFRDAIGIPKDTWQALFMLGIAGSAIWSIRALAVMLKTKSSVGVEELIDQLKKGAVIERTVSQASSISATTTASN